MKRLLVVLCIAISCAGCATVSRRPKPKTDIQVLADIAQRLDNAAYSAAVTAALFPENRFNEGRSDGLQSAAALVRTKIKDIAAVSPR